MTNEPEMTGQATSLSEKSQRASPKEARLALRRYAAQLLRTDERRLAILPALLFLLTAWVGGFILTVSPVSAVASLLFSEETAVGYLLVYVFPFIVYGLYLAFLVLPLQYGLIAYLLSLSRTDAATRPSRPTLAELFLPFSSGEIYGRVLLCVFGDLCRLAFALTPPVLLFFFFPDTASFSLLEAVLTFAGAILLAVVWLLTALFFLAPTYLTPALVWERPDLSVTKCRRLSRKLTKGTRHNVWMHHLRFIFVTILSLFTLGIVTVLHTLPLWLMTYAVSARSLLLPERPLNTTSEDV